EVELCIDPGIQLLALFELGAGLVELILGQELATLHEERASGDRIGSALRPRARAGEEQCEQRSRANGRAQSSFHGAARTIVSGRPAILDTIWFSVTAIGLAAMLRSGQPLAMRRRRPSFCIAQKLCLRPGAQYSS